MVRASHIFLGYLEFHHHCGFGHGTEKRAERFARLEIYRAVLDLYQHVVTEFSVKRNKFLISLIGPVRTVRSINECPPHHDSVIWGEDIRKHVGPVGMSTSVILRTRKALGVCLHQESSEIRYQ